MHQSTKRVIEHLRVKLRRAGLARGLEANLLPPCLDQRRLGTSRYEADMASYYTSQKVSPTFGYLRHTAMFFNLNESNRCISVPEQEGWAPVVTRLESF
jgi:hypothetical protein